MDGVLRPWAKQSSTIIQASCWDIPLFLRVPQKEVLFSGDFLAARFLETFQNHIISKRNPERLKPRDSCESDRFGNLWECDCLTRLESLCFSVPLSLYLSISLFSLSLYVSFFSFFYFLSFLFFLSLFSFLIFLIFLLFFLSLFSLPLYLSLSLSLLSLSMSLLSLPLLFFSLFSLSLSLALSSLSLSISLVSLSIYTYIYIYIYILSLSLCLLSLVSLSLSAKATIHRQLLYLKDIADHHGGTVPLHGRLFAQWLHHAYPRECLYPHLSGTTQPMSANEWKRETGDSSTSSTEALVPIWNDRL